MRRAFKIWVGIVTAAAFVGVWSPPAGVAGIEKEEKRELKETDRQYKEIQDDDLQETFSLADALAYGMLHNPRLKAAFYRWKASVYGIKQATSLDDPQVSFKTFINEVETRVGPQRAAYSVSQQFPFPGKLYLKGMAATAVSRERYAEYEKARLDFFYELKDAFFAYWFLRKQILVTEKNRDLLTRFEGVAQSKVKSGLSSNQDLLKAQVELGKLENELLTLNDYRAPVAARLNAVLNRDVATAISWPEDIDHEVVTLDEGRLLTLFTENNPDLYAARERIEEMQKKVWLARLDYLPDVNVAFDYIKVDKRPGGPVDNGQDAAALMFKMNVPLWPLKQKSQLDEARARRTSAEAEEDETAQNLSAKLKLVSFRVRDAARQIDLYRNALVPKAEQSLRASETGYTSGKVDFLNLVDSQRVLLDFQLSYYRAIRDYEQRLAELEMIVGDTLRG